MSSEVDFAVVETFSANPRHGERSEKTQGGAEEEQYRAEPDLQDASGKEHGMAGMGHHSNRSRLGLPDSKVPVCNHDPLPSIMKLPRKELIH